MKIDHDEIEATRVSCRKMIHRRALISAAVSVVPLPGLDVAVDVGLLARIIPRINDHFGLGPRQLAALDSELQIVFAKAVQALGTTLIGRVLTREMLIAVAKKAGVRLGARQAAKVLPVAGSAVGAILGYTIFLYIGNHHIDQCADIAARLRRFE